MSASCYLCVERPPPGDLRSHLLYHHLIENDEALPSIISLSRKENIETQTTVTWVNEFEYFDNRKKQNNDKNGHFEEQEIQKSKNSIAKFQRHKIIQSSKRNRRYPNHIPPIHLTQKRRLTERKSSSHEHIQKEVEDCLTGTDQEQNMNFLSHDDKPGGSKETTRPGVDKVKPKVWSRYSLEISIFIMVQKGTLMMFSLNMLDYPMSFLSLSTWTWNTFPTLSGTQTL